MFRIDNGHLISKCLYGNLHFFQKMNEKIQLNYYGTSSLNVFVRFFGSTENIKKTFRN